jgi:RNase P subunit RPR2
VSPERPSKNEDEYFARRDAELLRQQREAARKSAVALERKTHYMKCPKCGFDLFTGDWDGIQIDQCTNCHGIWCDAGEVEEILKRKIQPNILGRIFRAVAKGVTRS